MGVAALGIDHPRGEVFDQVAARVSNEYEAWERQVARTGYCAKPVRLVGATRRVDEATGEVLDAYSTDGEPDGSLLIACGDRRESRCPSCAARYRGDAFQIVASGLWGGKGIPESVSEHPMVFATFTAPSFGAVHTHRTKGGATHPCRPRRAGKCPHGQPLACWRRHDEDDEKIGQPLCSRCFDYEGQILWNRWAPELWRRTTTYIYRSLAQTAGIAQRRMEKIVRLSYVKVAEYQRRGAVHFHAVLRLDGRHLDDPDQFYAPPERFSTDMLQNAVKEATVRVSAPLPVEADAQPVARWGPQLDIRAIHSSVSALTPKAVAAYVAKYATKSSDDLGIGGLAELKAEADRDGHLVALVRAAQRLGGRVELRELRLDECAHALGFKGHWSTKSRRYSTTFTKLRRARRDYARRVRSGERVPLEACAEECEDFIGTNAEWRYLGSGYRNTGEAWLAQAAAVRAREYRRLAREDLSIRAMNGR